MSITQFAMIEELAFLIKDNLPSKHLVLSIEEILVDFLLHDTSGDGVLELEPMSSYNRLLLHRLADIFGFAHVSIGDGDDRHLVLERCTESSIPSILVSDILWQNDEHHSPQSHTLLKRKEVLPASKTKISIQCSLEEREAAYLAARQRIFSGDEDKIKDSVTSKPRNIPVAARRMIAHALGQKNVSDSSSRVVYVDRKECEGEVQNEELKTREESESHKNRRLRTSRETTPSSGQSFSSSEKKKIFDKSQTRNVGVSRSEGEVQKKPAGNKAAITGKAHLDKDNLKQEHLGAAKRMFAHALGFNGTKETKEPPNSSKTKPVLEKE